MTIEELAERCDPPLHYNYVGAIERGEYKNISLTGLLRISKGLKIPIEEIIRTNESDSDESTRKKMLDGLLMQINALDTNEMEFVVAVTNAIIDEMRVHKKRHSSR
jgi:hypothetical protein